MYLLASTRNFLKSESAAGMMMILAAAIAIIFANSGFAGIYKDITDFTVPYSGLALKNFTKDILMVVFFFMIGMELKKEAKEGFLQDRRQIALPLIAAAGGMIMPALVFFAFNYQSPELLHGWAIPSATDIAFAVCILLLITRNFSPAAKVFLLTIAIFDDLGAILVIAFFYSSGLHLGYLLFAAVPILFFTLFNYLRITNTLLYVICGAVLAYLLHEAGIHTTIAGVITALYIPFKGREGAPSPLKSLIHKLHLPVNFLILPLFAFVSAGVAISGLEPEQIFSSVPLGIIFGLFFGKQIGIFVITYICVKLKIAPKPEGSSWLDIYIVSIVAGIGFTMSLFVGMLAYYDPILQEEVKIGVLIGSLLSTIFAAIIARIGIIRTRN